MKIWARVKSVLVVTVLVVSALSGCDLFWGNNDLVLDRLDIVGATGLYIGSSAAGPSALQADTAVRRSSDSLNLLFKVMPDGSTEVVEQYNTDGDTMVFDLQISAIYDLNDDWVFAGYGYNGDSIEKNYLVSKSTGNVFDLTEIVKIEHNYWNDYYANTSEFYVFGDTMYILGHPYDAEVQWPDHTTDVIFEVDLSDTSAVTGTPILSYSSPTELLQFLALESGTLLLDIHLTSDHLTMARLPSGATRPTNINFSSAFVAGADAFLTYFGWETEQLTEYRVDQNDLIVSSYTVTSVGHASPASVVEVADRLYLFGMEGFIDLTDYRTGGTVTTSYPGVSQIRFVEPFSETQVALYYKPTSSSTALDLVDVTDGSRVSVFSDSAFILDSMAVDGGKIYMGGLDGSTGRQVVAIFDGSEISVTEVGSTSTPIIITPIN